MCFDAAFSLAHESLLKAAAKSAGIELPGTLRECEGCMLANGIRAPIAKQTSNRSDQKLGRVFVFLSGEKELLPHGRSGMEIYPARQFAVHAGVLFA